MQISDFYACISVEKFDARLHVKAVSVWRNMFDVAKFHHGGVKYEYDTHLYCNNFF